MISAPSKPLRILLAGAVAALMLAFVPVASAASVDQIVQDAKDGQIDRAYSKSDLNAALASPLLKTYAARTASRRSGRRSARRPPAPATRATCRSPAPR